MLAIGLMKRGGLLGGEGSGAAALPCIAIACWSDVGEQGPVADQQQTVLA